MFRSASWWSWVDPFPPLIRHQEDPNTTTTNKNKNHHSAFTTTNSLEMYPNPLGITPAMRANFHPVLRINQNCVAVLDLSQESGQSHLIPKEDQQNFIQNRNNRERLIESHQETCYTIGKYDENRLNLYSSELFQDSLNSISGYDGARTLHVGVDLGGPVGEDVYSFWDGVVHSVGYNPDLGDYGYVVVVEYDLSDLKLNNNDNDNVNSSSNNDNMDDGNDHQDSLLDWCTSPEEELECKDGSINMKSHVNYNRFWALYGHLDASTINLNTVGKHIKKGDVLGHLGDVHENGGWSIPHVHFQLTIYPPVTHDLPGAVTMQDRVRALIDFPDPRFVLGEIY